MEIRQLYYFLEVANEENISKAAQKLFISQPSLSRVMKELEEELDTQLFIKTNRATKLTEEGLILKQRAQEILSLVKKTEDEFKGASDDIYATIHIGAGETPLFQYIAQAAYNVSKKYPHIHFEYYSGIGPELLNHIQQGILEFCFLPEPIDLGNLNAIYLKEYDTYGLIVRKDSEYASKKTISKEDLLHMPIIMTRKQQIQSDDWLSQIYKQLNVVTSGAMPLNSIKLVEAGIGNFITIEREEYYHMENTTFVPFEEPLTRKWMLVWKNYEQLPKAHQVFIDELNTLL